MKNKKICTLDSAFFQKDDLYIQVGYKRKDQTGNSKLGLLFVERYTSKRKEYPLSNVNKRDTLFQASLTDIDLHSLMIEGKDWDVYVNEESKDLSERARVGNNSIDLELLYYVKNEQMLTPFTTNNGNISFKSKVTQLITQVEQLEFIDKEKIVIKGYVTNPQWVQQPAGLEKTMVIQSRQDDDILKIPLQTVERQDLAEKSGRGDVEFFLNGFEAIIQIENLLSRFGTETSLKTYIELTYTADNKKFVIESPPIKLKSPTHIQKSLIKKSDGAKKIIRLSRTKKARQLNIKISDYILKNEVRAKIKKKLVAIKRHRLIKDLYKSVFEFLGKLPANKKLVIFESFAGKQFSDNPRAIYEYLQENDPTYQLYWSVDRNFLHHFQDRNLNCIRRFSIKWLLLLPRARYWVINSRMPLWIPKPKHTVYLQTWHGTPLKRLAADMDEVYMPGTTAEKYKKNFINEAKNWDYLISPNAYSTKIFRSAFQFEKNVLETGYPRNDFICNNNDENTIDKLKATYGIPWNKHVLLYAPTWRDNQFYAKGKYRFDIQLDLDLLQKKLGKDYCVLFRLHYLVAENLDLTPYEGFAYDFSNHEDIRELYLMADILMTDYSSVFFDYGNLKRPMIFYVYDIDSYRDNLRGFYFNFEKQAPGQLVKTTEEVITTIKEIEESGFKQSPQFEEFYQKFCYLECGDSSRKVVEQVFSK